jgi:hypothetical protein
MSIVLRKGTRIERSETFDLGSDLDFGPQSASGIPSIIYSGLGGSGGGGPTLEGHPDDPPAVADAMDDEFTDVALDAKWVLANAPTVAFIYHRLHLKAPANVGDNFRSIHQPLPVGTSRFRCKLTGMASDWDTNYWGAGFWIKDAVSNRFLFFGPGYTSGLKLLIQQWTDINTFNANIVGQLQEIRAAFDIYLEVEFTATHNIFRCSYDGVIYTEMYRGLRTAWLTNNPGYIGLTVNANNAAIESNLVAYYFRRVA